MTLHDELQRIAERAPGVEVRADTWTRARRARTRDAVLTLAGVVATLVLVAGAAVWVPRHLDPPVADSHGLGVPDHLYAVPERMSDRRNDGTWMREEVTDDPTVVGVGAAAWVTRGGLPVVVDAEQGGYHLLDLPDFAGDNATFADGLGTPVVALSPDGRDLAYGYAVFGPDAATEPIPTGIRVVDLTTGSVRDIPVPGKEGTAISHIEWSPDGSWLAFTGMRQDAWTAMSMASRGSSVLGRIPPQVDSAEVRPISNDQVALSVDDRGTVQWQNGKIRTWGTGRADARDLDSLGRVDGQWLTRSDNELTITSGQRHTVVGEIDPSIGEGLTVAADLMTHDHPTVERSEPDWPRSEDTMIYTFVGTVTLAALLGAVLLGRPYRRRPAR